MYFFSLNGLVNHLKEEKNTEYESFQYLLGWIIFSSFSTKTWFEQKGHPGGDLKLIIASLVGGAIGACIASLIVSSYFRSNGGRSGKHFLHRIMALTWVVGWRLSVVLIPSVTLFYYYLDAAPLLALAGLLGAFFIALLYAVMTVNYRLKQIHVAAEGRPASVAAVEPGTDLPEL